jgi:hypothetical protein
MRHHSILLRLAIGDQPYLLLHVRTHLQSMRTAAAAAAAAGLMG